MWLRQLVEGSDIEDKFRVDRFMFIVTSNSSKTKTTFNEVGWFSSRFSIIKRLR